MKTGTKLHRDLGSGRLLTGHALPDPFEMLCFGVQLQWGAMPDALGCCQALMKVQHTETEGMQGGSKFSLHQRGQGQVSSAGTSRLV